MVTKDVAGPELVPHGLRDASAYREQFDAGRPGSTVKRADAVRRMKFNRGTSAL